jgi:hypothetical protein
LGSNGKNERASPTELELSFEYQGTPKRSDGSGERHVLGSCIRTTSTRNKTGDWSQGWKFWLFKNMVSNYLSVGA